MQIEESELESLPAVDQSSDKGSVSDSSEGEGLCKPPIPLASENRNYTLPMAPLSNNIDLPNFSHFSNKSMPRPGKRMLNKHSLLMAKNIN